MQSVCHELLADDALDVGDVFESLILKHIMDERERLERGRHGESVVKPKEHINEQLGVKANVNGQRVDKQPIRNQKKKEQEEVEKVRQAENYSKNN